MRSDVPPCNLIARQCSHWTLKAWVLLALVTTQGCTTIKSWAEATNAQCSDKQDNDGDRLIDCDDPDCWAASVCAAQALYSKSPQAGDYAGDARVATMDMDASTKPPRMDAVVQPDVPDPMPADSSMDSPVDASMPEDSALPPQDLCANVVCTGNAICQSGECFGLDAAMPPPETISMKIRITAAIVPLIPIARPADLSYDPAGSNSNPDPFVIIYVNGTEVFRTSTVVNAIAPTWNETGVRLDITAYDEVTFEARDDDSYTVGTGNSELIFDCTPDLPTTQPTTSTTVPCSKVDSLYQMYSITAAVDPAN